jgi:hypothetical protein
MPLEVLHTLFTNVIRDNSVFSLLFTQVLAFVALHSKPITFFEATEFSLQLCYFAHTSEASLYVVLT